MKICRCCKQVTSQSSLFGKLTRMNLSSFSKVSLSTPVFILRLFSYSDLGCGYKTGCYMPVFHLPILYMEIKIPPPLSVPLGHLSLHSTRLFIIFFLWTKITDSSLPWLEAQRQDACSRFSSPGLYLCRFSALHSCGEAFPARKRCWNLSRSLQLSLVSAIK